MFSINFAKLSLTATVPTKGTHLAAGYDLYSDEDCVIPPGKNMAINTNIAMAIRSDQAYLYGQIAERSGLALKSQLIVGGGVIDQDYTGPIKVIIHNISDTLFRVEKGMRIAQLIIHMLPKIELVEVEELSKTNRGSAGFGSTGK
jgi:dUTP pyrophosphatase